MKKIKEIWKNIRKSKIGGYARKNRKKPTLATLKMKEILHGLLSEFRVPNSRGQLKRRIKLRSERIALNYILDFYLTKVKIGIEVDGGYHKTQELYDLERDNKLMDMGFLMLRFTNNEVLCDPCRVREILKKAIENRIDNAPANPDYTRRMEKLYKVSK